MKNTFFFLIFLLPVIRIAAQTIPIEVMVGNEYVYYQHAIAKPLQPYAKFGWRHITSILVRYNTDAEQGKLSNEIMSQAYITMKISNSITIMGGGFYTNVTNYRGSVGVQWVKKTTDWLFVLNPRADIQQKGAFDIVGMIEYQPKIKDQLQLYSRLQIMTNHGPNGHNRSYQQFRIGLNYKDTQFGLALHLDEYGPKAEFCKNTGLFIRTALF